MKFSDAELQSLTGYPIVSGHLAIGSSADMGALGIPKHQRVLLACPRETGAWTLWPVADATPREDGFYDVTQADTGLVFDGLSQQVIDDLVSRHEGQPLLRGGAACGALMRRG